MKKIDNTKNFIGRRIKIVGNHPHSGECGVLERFVKTVFGSEGWVVKLEDCPHGTNEYFVFDMTNIKFV